MAKRGQQKDDRLVVRPIDDPLPTSSFGSIGVYAEVEFEPDLERPLLSLGYSDEQLRGVDATTLSVFQVDVERKSFRLVPDSTVDLEARRVLARIDRPGIYGLIGLPEDPDVLETILFFERHRPELLREAAGGGPRELQLKVCGLILCLPPGQRSRNRFGGFTEPRDLCELCLGIEMPGRGLPELQLLPPRGLRPEAVCPPPGPKEPAGWKVLAWGRNHSGQLGDGTTIDRNTQVWVSNLSGVVAVAAGGVDWTGQGFSLALKSDGTVWGWGGNGIGQLGVVTPTSTLLPIPAATGVTGVKQISVGALFGLALKADGTVWGWGDNDSGQLGQSPGVTGTSNVAPMQVPGVSGIVAIATGDEHSLALAADGSVWAWGWNNNGQTGTPASPTQPYYDPVPKQVAGLSGVVAIGAGGEHSLAVRSDGSVWTWGRNQEGQLGTPSGAGQSQPAQVAGITEVKSVSGGTGHSLALRQDGTVWAWGWNASFALGAPGPDRYTPGVVPNVSGIAAISAGTGHSLALSAGGTLWGWGWNIWGQVGNGTTANGVNTSGVVPPAQVVGPPVSERAIAAGERHSLAVGS